jgi:tripeptidyl-peptidase-1
VLKNTGEWVTFATNVSTIENMLSSRFGWYTHEPTGRKSLHTLAYSIPEQLHDHVNFLSPTTKFPSIHEMRSTLKPGNPDAVTAYQEWAKTQSLIDHDLSAVAPPDAVCGRSITPQCLLNLYNVSYGPPASTSQTNKLSFASFLTQYARYADLASFESSVATYAKGHNFTVISLNNGGNDQGGSEDATEANLDAKYEAGVGYPVPIYEFSTGGYGPIVPDAGEAAGSNSNEPYVNFLQGVLAMSDSDIPQTISISYGDDEQTWPIAQAQKICNMFAQLGSRGVTVLFASGDNGPSGAGDYCENNAQTQQQYVPSFPATCPYVTTVGGTTGVPETVASLSGGGFSNYFGTPSYQSSAVQAYLSKQSSTFKKYYNASGRGYPDVAAQAENFVVVNMGSTEPVSGTSAATPTFASLVGLLNAARISQGKPTLGFLNPLLYQNPSALNDITTGSSSGCSAGRSISGAGWKAATGWDAATGLGTANFGKLLSVVAPGVANTGGVLGGKA